MVKEKKTKVVARTPKASAVEVQVPASTESPKQPLVLKVLPAVYGGLLIMAFAIGVLWQKVENLSNTAATNNAAVAQQAVQATPVPVTLDQIKNLFDGDFVKFGEADKPLLFVEVADPSCPFCHIASGKNPSLNRQVGTQFILNTDGGTYQAPVVEMRKLVEEGKASYLTLYSIGHGNGDLAQKALYCAHEKGRFWQAHDLLYSTEGYDVVNDKVKNDVANAGVLAEFLKPAVDPAFIKSCLESGKYDERLKADLEVAASLGVQGTPAFFVNGTRFPGAVSFSEMKSVVDAALK